jgi:two-component system NarL family sensor kinase
MPTRYEMKYIRKDGSVRWMDASLTVLEYEGAPAILIAAMDTTERKEDEDRLRDAHMQLLNAREEERRHLAGELHDSLAQDLVVLQLVLQCGTSALANSAVPQEWLTEATAMCTKMIGDIRRLSHGLYPPMLETLGLRRSLQSLAEQYEVAGRKVEIHWKCAEDRRYSRPVEITLFRIVQEAMSNAVRHGLADHAEIHVSCTGYSVILEVIDNGRGFENKPPEQMGLGMRSMQDRLIMVDGTLTVTSQPGRTCVRAEIPGILPEEIESQSV